MKDVFKIYCKRYITLNLDFNILRNVVVAFKLVGYLFKIFINIYFEYFIFDCKGVRSNNFYLDTFFFIIFFILLLILLKISIVVNFTDELLSNIERESIFLVNITGHQWYWEYTLNFKIF